jgi:transposase InsO family protein
MCQVLVVARSGYYAWLTRLPSKRARANECLDHQIKLVFNQHQGRYGVLRIRDELHDQGVNASKNRVARRLQYLGLRARVKRKIKVTTDSAHSCAVAPNYLNRQFNAQSPNEKWVGDISYIWTAEGWLYLAVVIDLYSRLVVGWSMQSSLARQLVCDALLMALRYRQFPAGILCHSDRGSQYCSADYQRLLQQYGLICSMSRRGNCWDNSVAESFFHSLKVELVYHKRYLTRQAAKQSIFYYIETYYNRVRRHSTLGSMAPIAFEPNYANSCPPNRG